MSQRLEGETLTKGPVQPVYLGTLTAALRRRLPASHIEREHVRGDRFRFIVISDEFEPMDHPERQQIVWDVADATLSKTDLWKVAMIITINPSDLPND